ncbi:MAG: hypothetical protein ABIJ14_03655 [Nanoarchaeota archaeon]
MEELPLSEEKRHKITYEMKGIFFGSVVTGVGVFTSLLGLGLLNTYHPKFDSELVNYGIKTLEWTAVGGGLFGYFVGLKMIGEAANNLCDYALRRK